MATELGADRKAFRNVHDSWFRAVLEAQERAADFQRRHVPASIVHLLAGGPPQLQDGTFLYEHLGDR